MIHYLKIIYLSLTLIPVAGWPQAPFFRQHELPEEVRNSRLDVLYQSRGDFIWLGGGEALMRYDGFDFDFFYRTDTSHTNKVTAIFKDEGARMWIGYADGGICHLTSNHALSLWQPEEGLPKVPISGFAQDPSGSIWIATYGEGLYYWNGSRMYHFGEEDGLAGLDIYVLAKDTQGRMWVGTDLGISICWLNDGKKHVRNIGREDGLPDEIVRYILPDGKGHCWVGTYDRGFVRIDENTLEISFPYKDWRQGVINCMELPDQRSLWIGTEGKGVWRFDLQDNSLAPLHHEQLPSAKITDLHADWEGNLWVLSHQGGLLSTNSHFSFLPNPLENVQAMRIDRDNRLWVGDQTGLYRYQTGPANKAGFEKVLSENVLSLFEDAFGNIWVGTFGNGIILLHPASGQQRQITEAHGLPNGSILSIDGTDKMVWLATLGGVVELDCSKDIMNSSGFILQQLDHETELETNFIYKVFVDQKNRTWFGTDGKGISVLENGVLTSYQQADSIPIRSVYSITEDQQGHIWFSTLRDGIYRFDGSRFLHLGHEEGLLDLNIRSLVRDQNGKILIVHPGGIDLLDPLTQRLIYFGREVGIGDIDPNLNTCAYDARGDIWIGTNEGIIHYTALSDELSTQPTTILKNVSVNFSPLDCTEVACLAYDQNNLIFEYVGLWYTNPAAIRYRYKLEGYNHDWIISKDNQAVFPSLPHGKYTFMVSASGNGLFAEEAMIRYEFSITSPIWKRPWFVALSLLIAVALISWWIRTREGRMQREAALVKEKLESQFEALKSQINPHFLFNNFNTLITIIEENPALAVEYVEKLADFYRSILQYREQELIPLEEELRIVQDYTFLLKKRYGKNLNTKVEIAENGTCFVVPLSLQMLVENAVKHNIISKHQPLTIRIYQEDPQYITICNNLQKKIVAERSTGFGLESIVKRYGLLTEKKVHIREDHEEFKVSIPVMNNSKA